MFLFNKRWYCSRLIPPSRKTSFHYIRLNRFRTGWLPEHFQQVQSSGNSGNSKPVQEVHTTFKKFAHSLSPFWRTQWELVWCDRALRASDSQCRDDKHQFCKSSAEFFQWLNPQPLAASTIFLFSFCIVMTNLYSLYMSDPIKLKSFRCMRNRCITYVAWISVPFSTFNALNVFAQVQRGTHANLII